MTKKINSITFYPNGCVTVVDQEGNQINELQKTGWMDLYFAHLERKGYDPSRIYIRSRLNDGTWKKVLPFKNQYGEWKVKNFEPDEAD